MSSVVLFPYLLLQQRARVASWELIPAHELKPQDVTAQDVYQATLDHLRLYRLPSDQGKRAGCIARPEPGRVGGPFDSVALLPLRRAVLAGLLDQNLPWDTKKPNAAHYVSTSDNAAVFAHLITPNGAVSVDYGAMVSTMHGGIHAGQDPGAIAPPIELHSPLFGCAFDAEYADAMHGVLLRGDEQARRVGTAIDWYSIAWSNTTSINQDTRIVAMRCGFEALLGVGDEMKASRDALSALLDLPGEPKGLRQYPNRSGTKMLSENLTELEWWFTNFVFLRNKIIHGAAITPSDYKFNGASLDFHGRESP